MPSHWNWCLPCPTGTENHPGWKFSLNSDRSRGPQQSTFLGFGRSMWSCLQFIANSWFWILTWEEAIQSMPPSIYLFTFPSISLPITWLACPSIHLANILNIDYVLGTVSSPVDMLMYNHLKLLQRVYILVCLSRRKKISWMLLFCPSSFFLVYE